MNDTPANLLIISDLHLGEDIKPGEGESEQLDRLEIDLCSFLDHHADQRLDERPWHLVINGDMVDFISVCLMPADAEMLIGLHPDDHLYGLGMRPHAGCVKMQRVMRRHQRVFGSLARFLGGGNRISVVLGNHDAELFWPEVQQAFRDGLSRLCSQPLDPEALTFHEWFFLVPGMVYVEHGHQYDGYCSFEAILHPVAPDEEEIDYNVSAAAMKYVSNHFAPDKDGSFWGYLMWTWGRGVRGAPAVAGSFLALNLRLFTEWHRRTPAAVKRIRERHLERLRALAEHTRLSEAVLRQLDDLRARPMSTEAGKIIQAMMLDRLAAATVASIVLATAPFVLPWSWLPALGVAVVVALFYADKRFMEARATIYPQRNMRRVARAIRKLVRAPIVVFGHAHDPAVERHEDGGWYVNTGHWFADSAEQVKSAFTHLRIVIGDKGPRPELRRWVKGKSQAFLPAR